MFEESRVEDVRQDFQRCDPFRRRAGSAIYFRDEMYNNMYRRGTVAATSVAELPQGIGCWILARGGFCRGAQGGSDVLRSNRRFAAYRGFQSPSRHHTSSRRNVPRHATAQI